MLCLPSRDPLSTTTNTKNFIRVKIHAKKIFPHRTYGLHYCAWKVSLLPTRRFCCCSCVGMLAHIRKKYVNRFKYYLMRGSVFKLINNWGSILRETTLITHSKYKKKNICQSHKYFFIEMDYHTLRSFYHEIIHYCDKSIISDIVR